jgi:hypothetical protein
MAHAASDSTRAPARLRVGIQEHPQNLAAGGAITLLALERFDLVGARCELNAAHRAFLLHSCALTHQRFTRALRLYRTIIEGC